VQVPEDFDRGFDKFPMGPGDVVVGPQELGHGFSPSCHPGGPGPAFGGPEFPNFGPMDGPACGMGMISRKATSLQWRNATSPQWHDDGTSTSHDGGITDDGNCRPSSTFANGKRSNKTHGHAISTCIWSWKERSMSPRRATEEEKGRSQQWF
jgi:hypothetical protein